MLSANEIEKRVAFGDITIKPFNRKNMGPNSYDVRLNDELLIYKTPTLDVKGDNKTERLKIPEEGLVLLPGVLYLGSTVEKIGSNMFIAGYDGRSSMGRLGILSHCTAAFIDIGFVGNVTLEIFVVHPVRVYPNMRIGQISFHPVEGEIDRYYDGKYNHADGVQASESWRDWI